MNFVAAVCKKAFALALRLYPADFRREYGEELQSDFAARLEEARSTSGGEFFATCLREVRDLPVNLLRTHLEKKRMYRILHAPSLRLGGKGALAFGLSFVVVNVMDGVVNTAIVQFVTFHFLVWMGDRSQRTWGTLINMGENALSWAVASLVGGFLFAALFTGKHRFWRFAGLGTLGFFVPGLIARVLMFSANYVSWFDWVMEALAGLALGAVVALLAETQPRKIVLLVAGAILYPCLVQSSLRLMGALFPPGSPLFTTPAESYRQVALGFMLAGLFFGLLMGLILGWRGKTGAAGQSA